MTSLELMTVITLAVFGVLAIWTVVVALLSAMSGYYLLVRTYPPKPEDHVLDSDVVSGWLGMMSLGGALQLDFGERGLHVAPLRIFRPFFAAAMPCIPWDCLAVERADNRPSVPRLYTTFLVRGTWVALRLRGEAARSLEDAIEKRRRAEQ